MTALLAGPAFRLLGWLAGTARGRRVAAALLLAAAAFYALWRSRARGYAAREAEEAARAIRAAAERIETDEHVRRMGAADRARALRRWVR